MIGVQVCSKVYTNAASLHWHRRTQHLTIQDDVPMRFPCADCGQSYGSLRYLKVGSLFCLREGYTVLARVCLFVRLCVCLSVCLCVLATQKPHNLTLPNFFAMEHDEYNSRDFNKILLSNKNQQVVIVSCTLGQICYVLIVFSCCFMYFF